MVQRIGGARRKTRYKLSKGNKEKGKISITNYFQDLEKGQKVVLKAEPAIQKGMYSARFYGKSGIIKGKQGTNYKVFITDGKKEKILIVHPVHLRRM